MSQIAVSTLRLQSLLRRFTKMNFRSNFHRHVDQFLVFITCLTAALLLVGCLDKGDDESPPIATPSPMTPQAVVLQFDRADLLMPLIGQSYAVVAMPIDGGGNEINVGVTYASSDETVVSVDTMGNVTALGLGNAKVLATVAAVDATGGEDLVESVDVTVAELKSNARYIPIESVRELVVDRITDDNGFVARFRIDGAAIPIAVDDWVVSDDWQVLGAVISVQQDGSDLIVEYRDGQMIEVIENGSIRISATIDDFEFPPEVVVPVQTKAGLQKPGGPIASQSIESEVGGYNTLLNVLFPGEFTTSISQGIKCKVNNRGSRLFNIVTDLNPTARFDSINYQVEQDAVLGFAGSGRVSVNASFVVSFDGRIDWDGQLRGTVTCKDTLLVPATQEGPLVLSMPVGIGFSFTAELDDLSGSALVNGEMPVNLSVGLGYDIENGEFAFLDAPIQLEADSSELDIRIDVPAVQDLDSASGELKLEAFAFAVLRAGAGLGTSFGIYKKFDSLKMGVRETFDLASIERQARDASFSAKAEFEVFLKRDLADARVFFLAPPMSIVYPAIVIAEALGLINLETLLDYDFAINLATTPRGVTSAASDSAIVGEPMDFSITLDPTRWLGSYQIDELIVYRVDGEGQFSILTEVARVEAESGQTEFMWSWTPEQQDVGSVQFVTFISSLVLLGQPIQVEEVFEIPVIEDSLAPQPEFEASANAVISGRVGEEVNGLIEYRNFSASDFQEREPFQASASTSAEGFAVTASSSAGQLSYQISYSGNQCGDFFAQTRGVFALSVENSQPGRTIGGQATFSGPTTFSVSGLRESDEFNLSTTFSVRADDKSDREGLTGSASGLFENREGNAGWRTDALSEGDRLYSGGSLTIDTGALEIIEESGQADLSFRAGVGFSLNVPCDEEPTSRSFNANFTMSISPSN